MNKDLLKEVEEMCKVIFKKKIPDVIIEEDRTIINHANGQVVHMSSPTIREFQNNNSRFRLIMGAVRSGKSSGCCAEIIRRACAMPECSDGVRRVRVAVIRASYPELKTTTIKTWQSWFGMLGECRTKFDSPIEFVHRFNDGNGEIELTLWFMPLESENDVNKLLSLELTFVYCNELRTLYEVIVDRLMERIGQFPSKKDCPHEFWRGIIADTNPPDEDHWIVERFEKIRPNNEIMFKQPPAVIKNETNDWMENPNGENIENLPRNYYLDLVLTLDKKKDYNAIRVYYEGKYGFLSDNQPIYANYNDSMHSADKLDVIEGAELIMAWDFGLTPACLVVQHLSGQIRVIKEFTTERMFLSELGPIVFTWLSTNFPGVKFKSIGDPAGIAQVGTDGKNSFDMLRLCGIPTESAKGSGDKLAIKIEPRINSVNKYLTSLTGCAPALIIDRASCPTLRSGFNGKYFYKTYRVGGQPQISQEPAKNFYSHIHDCMQYICMFLTGYEEKKELPSIAEKWAGLGGIRDQMKW